VANVGPGFDVFGFALDGAGDTVEAWRVVRSGVRLREVTGDGGKLPRDPRRNVATAVASKMLREAGAAFGVEMTLHKGLPLGSGLGSSAASAVAAAVALNALLGDRFSKEELLDFARCGEKVACGSAHADNAAPALYGGFTLVLSTELPKRGLFPAVDIIRLVLPKNWYIAVVHPHFELPTKKARAILPDRVPLSKMTSNVGNAAALVAALAKNDIALFGRALMGDRVIEPVRAKLIPGYKDVKKAAMQAGAFGAAVSGAGPSMFALTADRAGAKVVAERMAAAWRKVGIAADPFVSPIGTRGARVLSKE
jgi:homoserine kinase